MKEEKREHENEAETKKTGNKNLKNAVWVLISAVLVISLFNQISIGQASDTLNRVSLTAQVSGSNTQQNNIQQSAGPNVIPKGVPKIYGPELSVSFDDVSAANPSKADLTIKKIAVYDTQITLSGAEMDRYKKITSMIACEYCCGAQSLTFSNGQPACGCAHSYAMRGLAKYLLKNHASEYTDDQILEELGKWKTLFFPGVITKKASVLQQQGIELNYINLASNKYRGIEAGAQGSSGSMVGGC